MCAESPPVLKRSGAETKCDWSKIRARHSLPEAEFSLMSNFQSGKSDDEVVGERLAAEFPGNNAGSWTRKSPSCAVSLSI